MRKFKKTILLDLDGVLNCYDGKYQENFIPTIREGAEDFVKKLYENYQIILFTTRDKNLTTNWVKENRLEKYFSEITNIKKPAFLLIDDRCIKFNGNYNDLLDNIENFKVWYK